MKPGEIKQTLGKKVRFVNERLYLDTEYIFIGGVIRRNETGFFYQAELRDIKSNSIMVCDLNDVFMEEVTPQ